MKNNRDEITAYLDNFLKPSLFPMDSSLNGLQFEGKENVNLIAVTVDASIKSVEEASKIGADYLIVHHGIFWGKPFSITGNKKKLFKTLIETNISLYASHLPLDANKDLGNNFTLGRLLGLKELTPAFKYHGAEIGVVGENKENLSFLSIKDRLLTLCGANLSMKTFNFGPEIPKRIGIISGGGSSGIFECPLLNVDTFISGEPSQFTYHVAFEEKINMIFVGHYASETVGVIEVGKDLEKKFNIPFQFIDIATGI